MKPSTVLKVNIALLAIVAAACSQGPESSGDEDVGEDSSEMTTMFGGKVDGYDRSDLDWETLSDTCDFSTLPICQYVNRVNAYEQAGVWARASTVQGFPYRWIDGEGNNTWKYLPLGTIPPGTFPYGKCHGLAGYDASGNCPRDCAITYEDGSASPWGSECAGFVAKAWGIAIGGVKGYKPNVNLEKVGRAGGSPAFLVSTRGWDSFESLADLGTPLVGDIAGSNSHTIMYWGGDVNTEFISAECEGCNYGCGFRRKTYAQIKNFKWARLSDDILYDVQTAALAAGDPLPVNVQPFWKVVTRR